MEAAARVCLPEPSLCSPRAHSCCRLDAREAEGCVFRGAADSRPRAVQMARELGPAVSTAPHPPPFPFPLPLVSPSPCPAVRGERLRGAGSGYPLGHCPLGRGLSGEMRPCDPKAKPTPRIRAGLQPDRTPAPRPAAVRPPPSEADPQPGHSQDEAPLPPSGPGVLTASGGARGALGEGSTNPCTASRALSGSGPGTGARAAGAGGRE